MNETNLELKMYTETQEVMTDYRGHFFSKGAKRFFKSRVGSSVYGGKYFYTSECGPSGVRRWSIREIKQKRRYDYGTWRDVTIETVGEFGAWGSARAALAAIKQLLQEVSQ